MQAPQKGLSMQYIADTTPTFDLFYQRHVSLVRRILVQNYANYYDYLDDLTQETFIRAWKAYDRLGLIVKRRRVAVPDC